MHAHWGFLKHGLSLTENLLKGLGIEFFFFTQGVSKTWSVTDRKLLNSLGEFFLCKAWLDLKMLHVEAFGNCANFKFSKIIIARLLVI